AAASNEAERVPERLWARLARSLNDQFDLLFLVVFIAAMVVLLLADKAAASGNGDPKKNLVLTAIIASLGFVGIAVIVRRLRRTSATLRDAQSRTQAILDTAADAILTVNDQGAIESCNAAAASMFGYARAELAGRPISFLLPALD